MKADRSVPSFQRPLQLPNKTKNPNVTTAEDVNFATTFFALYTLLQ
jgi:hypothetical protein